MNRIRTEIPAIAHGAGKTEKYRVIGEPFKKSTILPEGKKQGYDGVYVVIPAYNEGLVIGSLVLQIREYVDNVIVVDDGSADNTSHIAGLAGAKVITLVKNQGKAHALMEGFERAKQEGCRAAVVLDGDGQHNPDDIPVIIDPVLKGEADLVIGSRYLDQKSDIPAYRVLGQKTLDVFTNMGSAVTTTDSSSGFRALSKKALSNLDFKSEDYSIEFDMISHFSSRDLAITEVPITVNYDVPHKHKKNALLQGFDAFKDVLGIVGYKRPILLFGAPGGVFALIGITTGLYAMAEYTASAVVPFTASMVSIITLMLGLLLINSGLILNSMTQIIKLHR